MWNSSNTIQTQTQNKSMWGYVAVTGAIIYFSYLILVGRSAAITDCDKNTDVKYILLWTKRNCSDCAPFQWFPEGDDMFKQEHCPVQNCYITEDREMLGDYTKFDAVLFNGRTVLGMTDAQLPRRRSQNQTYVFVQLESADRFPVCHSRFDHFFNRTMTYVLTSDYPWPYLVVGLTNGTIIGPSKSMSWVSPEEMEPVDIDLRRRLRSKHKAVAWFVSNCHTRSAREHFVNKLDKELNRYNLTVDIYGRCGPLTCPRTNETVCQQFLATDYFFYLSFENSFSEDYATEKLLTALQHDTVPVVYGGANYTNFLPPGSYIDARAVGPAALARTVARLVSARAQYEDMFRWRRRYQYGDAATAAMPAAFCRLCQALQPQPTRANHNVYRTFRKWWNPNYGTRCS